MANDTKYQEILLKVIENLKSDDLATFKANLVKGIPKMYGPIAKDKVENVKDQEMVKQLIQTYGSSGAAKLTEITLVEMMRKKIEDPLKTGDLFPKVPYEQTLSGGLKDQTLIIISGQCERGAIQFEINFMRGNDHAFHFNPRFKSSPKPKIVRNHVSNGRDGDEENDTTFFPFTPGEPVEIRILCTNTGYSVNVDNHPLLEFKHRIGDLQNLTSLTIKKDISLRYVLVGKYLYRVRSVY
ncbi:hypothetical protein NFI96_032942, partial [Prochilodus magdalenae]